MKTCIVIDDSEAALKLMQRHIQMKSELELKGTFSSSIQGLQYLEKEIVDLVFIDIQMPDLNGLELIDTLRSRRNVHLPHFVLVTGFSEYALESYDYGVMDYLLKPITFKRFDAAVDRFLNLIKPSVQATNIPNDFFFADVDGVKTRFNCEEIVYIEGAGNYISIYTKASRFLLHKTMNSLIEILDPKQFIRVHKSSLVAIKHITGMRGNDLFLDYKGKQIELAIGITYKKLVLDRLNFI